MSDRLHMKRKILLSIVALVACSVAVFAQGRKGSLYINEVMVVNDSNFVDDFGQRSAWIELYNAKFAPLEISSVYITTDRDHTPQEILGSDDPEMLARVYAIPLGDVLTRIPKRQHVVFWADGMPSRGTFHTSFTLDPTRTNWIGLYDSDKETLIDSVTVPILYPNTSYARVVDGDPEKGWNRRDDVTIGADGNLKYITPSSNNVIRDKNDKIEKFHEMDENGFAMAVMAMGIVFSALLLLCLCFLTISKIGESISKRNKMAAHGIDKKEVAKEEHPDHDSGEEIAAIVMALHEHLNAHDAENTVLTINKVKRAYSPWSSKIYNMRHTPQR